MICQQLLIESALDPYVMLSLIFLNYSLKWSDMITLHHLEQSRSQRIVWLLESLAIPYQLVRHQRDPKTKLAPRELKQIHSLGKAPVIEDGDIVIAESGAIIEYLLDTYGNGSLVPETAKAKSLYRYWMHYAEGSLMPPLVMSLIFSKVPESPMPFFYPSIS